MAIFGTHQKLALVEASGGMHFETFDDRTALLTRLLESLTDGELAAMPARVEAIAQQRIADEIASNLPDPDACPECGSSEECDCLEEDEQDQRDYTADQ